MFSAGTVFWAWALDSHNLGRTSADRAIQQAMINLLADMGIQPETLQSGLIRATQSTDHDRPTTMFTGSGMAVVGHTFAIYGHSTDVGGVVAGNEFSIDGGASWHFAAGNGNWAASLVQTDVESLQVQVRAIDDSLNVGDPTAITVKVYDHLIKGTAARDLVVSAAVSFAKGSAAAEGKVKVRHSTNEDDVIFGKGGKDTINGLAGDDWIRGGIGNDKVVGGNGHDILIRGRGRDTFKFNAAIESTAAAPDSIVDFQSGRDKIDLRGMAIADGHFIGDTDFSGSAGEFRFDTTQRLLEGDLDGDGVADFAVKFGAALITTHDIVF